MLLQFNFFIRYSRHHRTPVCRPEGVLQAGSQLREHGAADKTQSAGSPDE